MGVWRVQFEEAVRDALSMSPDTLFKVNPKGISKRCGIDTIKDIKILEKKKTSLMFLSSKMRPLLIGGLT